jgi:hypothetical protein
MPGIFLCAWRTPLAAFHRNEKGQRHEKKGNQLPDSPVFFTKYEDYLQTTLQKRTTLLHYVKEPVWLRGCSPL